MIRVQSAIALSAGLVMLMAMGGCAEHRSGYRYGRSGYQQSSPWVGNDNHTGSTHAYDGNGGRNYGGGYGGGAYMNGRQMGGGNDMNNGGRGGMNNNQGDHGGSNGGDNNMGNNMNNH